jgi:hypothetical protein
MIDREYFTLVFKGDLGRFKLNPMNTKTPFGLPVAAGRGDAFEEADHLLALAREEAIRECADLLATQINVSSKKLDRGVVYQEAYYAIIDLIETRQT